MHINKMINIIVTLHMYLLRICDVLSSLIRKMNKTTCALDPFPTKLLMSRLSSILGIIICIVNLCFSTIIFLLIKKQGLDHEI